jgi:hypothetical protein
VATLLDVVTLYRDLGLAPDDPRAVGVVEPWVASFGGASEQLIPYFLGALDAAPVVP